MEIPEKVREYFNTGRRKIKSVSANDDYTLDILFDDGEIRVCDMSGDLDSPAFGALRDIEKFREVFIGENGAVSWDIDPLIDSRIFWNNRVDICPDACYLNGTPKRNRGV